MSQDQHFYEDLLIKFLYIKKSVREKIIPIISIELFERDQNREIIKHIINYIDKYNVFPKIQDSILVLNESPRNHLNETIMTINSDEYNNELLIDELEEFIREKMISNVCCNTMVSLSEDDGIKNSLNAPDKLREAYAFSFDQDIGLNLFESEDKLFNYLHEKKYIIPTNIQKLNEHIDGGIHNKSLVLFLAETNMGKSLVMSSLAVGNVLDNKNVLYISCELSENETGVRLLANLFETPMGDLKAIPKDKFYKRFKDLKDNFNNRIVIREFPPKSINANTIRTLLKKLELNNFKPDIIYLDQIGNMNSIHRVRADNTYTEMGKVTMEVRGVAIEHDLPIISAIQTNRDGFGSSEIDLKNTGDSLGFVQTADVVVAITQSEEFRAMGKFIWSILKNRFGINKIKFTVNVNYEKMTVLNDEDTNVEFQSDSAKIPNTSEEKRKISIDAISLISDINNNDEDEEEQKIVGWE